MKKTLTLITCLFSILSMATDYRNMPLDEYIQLLNEEAATVSEEAPLLKANTLTIDTRDTKKCRSIRSAILNNSSLSQRIDTDSLCTVDESNPYVSITMLDDGSQEYKRKINFTHIKDSYGKLSKRSQKLAKETRNVAILSMGVMGALLALPTSVTNWDESPFEANLGQKWKENVKEGPVVDEDDWMLNWIGHPYSGATYYVVARHSGFGRWESFGYSVFMSTFFWEYGIEAFAEVPSVQDLLITPIIGSLMGETFIILEDKIQKNGGKVLGSRTLGKTALVLLDPAGHLSRGLNRLIENDVFKESNLNFVYRTHSTVRGRQTDESYMGFELEFKF